MFQFLEFSILNIIYWYPTSEDEDSAPNGPSLIFLSFHYGYLKDFEKINFSICFIMALWILFTAENFMALSFFLAFIIRKLSFLCNYH